ncbi:MAG: hypothetical protein KAS66_00125 [Candidatus Omnitrophica bacterium]|nr:hypothetical protein [Candidatus Omnitrophota bacterium]
MCQEKIGEGVTGDDLPGVIEVKKGEHAPEDFDYLRHQIWPCGECAFYDGEPAENNLLGLCKRRAPAATEYDDDGSVKPPGYLYNRAIWPVVRSTGWCGESVPNEKAITDMKAESIKEVADRIGLKTLSEVKKESADALKVFEGENQDAKEINIVHIDGK